LTDYLCAESGFHDPRDIFDRSAKQIASGVIWLAEGRRYAVPDRLWLAHSHRFASAAKLRVGADDAEALAGRRLHHPPGADLLQPLGAERFEPAHLGFDVVGLDIQVDAAG